MPEPVTPQDSPDRWTHAVLATVAAALVGVAVHLRGGNYSPAALACVIAALVLAGLATILPGIRDGNRSARIVASGVMAVAICVQLTFAFQRPLLPSRLLAVAIIALVGVLILALPNPTPALRRVQRNTFPLLLIAYFALGVMLIQAVQTPVDVYTFQTFSSAALLEGKNPYAGTYPDTSFGTSPFYAPGVQVKGPPDPSWPAAYRDQPNAPAEVWLLKFGFPYPPLSLLMALPGYLFAFDVRYSHLLCITLAAALIGYARRGSPLGPVAAALLLLTPGGLVVLASSWTEPFVVLLLAAVVFCACRSPRLMPWMLGLFWAVKQYVFLSAPLTILLLPKPAGAKRIWDIAWRAALVAAIVTLPFFLWDVRAFWWSVIALQTHQPFRPDALSIPAAVYQWRGTILPSAVAFIAMAVAEAVGLLRGRRSPAGFAVATAFAFLAFFAFSKQAFANYYYFVIGALACAIGAADIPGMKDPTPTETETESPKSKRKPTRAARGRTKR